jgi:hypothetical protein
MLAMTHEKRGPEGVQQHHGNPLAPGDTALDLGRNVGK